MKDDTVKVDGIKYVKVQIPIEKIEGQCSVCIANNGESPYELCDKLYKFDRCERHIWKEDPSD